MHPVVPDQPDPDGVRGGGLLHCLYFPWRTRGRHHVRLLPVTTRGGLSRAFSGPQTRSKRSSSSKRGSVTRHSFAREAFSHVEVVFVMDRVDPAAGSSHRFVACGRTAKRRPTFGRR